MILNNRGQMRTVEAFLSILLLFSALAITTLISPASKLSKDNTSTVGMQALVSMDNDEQLGRLIDEGNWTTLACALNMLLPVGISYNLTVYDGNLQVVNNVSISNGVIPNQNIVSIQYPCASPNPQGNYYLIRLQLATAR